MPGQPAGGLAGLPTQLALAIEQAAQRYQVPPDLLAGIWRTESGSTFPNPAKNSSGYGGLFGTTDAYGPTQEQANLAASILAAGLRQSGGNVQEALSYYNSGKLVGGYTSVPGETTFGRVPVPGGQVAPPAQSGASPASVSLPTPGPLSGLSSGDVKSILDAITAGRLTIAQANTQYPGINLTPAKVQAGEGNFPTKIGNPLSSVSDLISFVTSWRFAEVVGGFALLLVGLVLLGRQFGVSAPGAATVARAAGK